MAKLTDQDVNDMMSAMRDENELSRLGVTDVDRQLLAGLSFCGLAYAAYQALSAFAKTQGWPVNAIVRTAAGELRKAADKRCKQ